MGLSPEELAILRAEREKAKQFERTWHWVAMSIIMICSLLSAAVAIKCTVSLIGTLDVQVTQRKPDDKGASAIPESDEFENEEFTSMMTMAVTDEETMQTTKRYFADFAPF